MIAFAWETTSEEQVPESENSPSLTLAEILSNISERSPISAYDRSYVLGWIWMDHGCVWKHQYKSGTLAVLLGTKDHRALKDQSEIRVGVSHIQAWGLTLRLGFSHLGLEGLTLRLRVVQLDYGLYTRAGGSHTQSGVLTLRLGVFTLRLGYSHLGLEGLSLRLWFLQSGCEVSHSDCMVSHLGFGILYSDCDFSHSGWGFSHSGCGVSHSVRGFLQSVWGRLMLRVGSHWEG